VELFAAIRRDRRVGELSIRELAEKYRVHRRTVRQALESATPPPRKTPVRTAWVLESFKPAIDEMLRVDLDAPRKQRHTVVCPAFSGRLNLCYFMLLAADSGTRCRPHVGSYSRVPSEVVEYYNGIRCTLSHPFVRVPVSDKRCG